MKVLIVFAVLCAAAVYCADQQSCQFCKVIGADLFSKFNNDLSTLTDDQLLSFLIDECKQRSTGMFEAVCESMSKSLCPLVAQHARAGESIDTICKEFELC
uniref:Saposin B-type domain-containing protein n=1 Tax=Syphacia muris TaxID=451379 RepID=A0A0N5AK95_9BILA